jgi:hypothetical protein
MLVLRVVDGALGAWAQRLKAIEMRRKLLGLNSA